MTKEMNNPELLTELPFTIAGSSEDGLYDSIVGGMQILHDRYVKDNLPRFVQDEYRHQRYRLLPFWLTGWGDAHRFLEPIRTLAEKAIEENLGKELEEMKVKAAYIRGVKRFIKKLYAEFDGEPKKLSEITRKNLAEVIRRATEASEFYDIYDANIDEMLAGDDQLRIRVCEQVRNRLGKLI